MTTTKASTNELPPLFISPLYSDCTIQVPLDDRSGFHTYNLHLCVLYKSLYFEKMAPNPKKVHFIPTLKSHFEIILRYIYNKKQIFYNDDNILDLITEGYRFSLNDFVSQLWSEFATHATPEVVIDALKRMEDGCEFYKKWEKFSLQTAIKRNILAIFDNIGELKAFKLIQLLLDSATYQNPDTILKKLRQWGKKQQIRDKVAFRRTGMEVAFMNNFRELNIEPTEADDGFLMQSFTAARFSKDFTRNTQEVSWKIYLKCVVGSTEKIGTESIKIVSVSPLKILLTTERYRVSLIIRLWDKEGTLYIAKLGEFRYGQHNVEFEILNAHEWAKDNYWHFELIYMEGQKIDDSQKIAVKQLAVFEYPPNLEKLSDFTVECPGENGPVVYKLHKFYLQKSPYFKAMFSMSGFIEAKTNKAKIETPSHLFEVILRYLYGQEPLKGITSIITDVILEASYFELTDFENELWSLFEREAEVTNCIKAVNLIESNMHFKIHRPDVMKVVAINIKAVLNNITNVPDWAMVRDILNFNCVHLQNPLLILKSINKWCTTHAPKNSKMRISKVFAGMFSRTTFPSRIAKEIRAKYPYLAKVNEKADDNITETILIATGNSVELKNAYHKYDECVTVSNDGKLVAGRWGADRSYELHDQLSSHCMLVHNGTDLTRVVENIEEWKYNGYYRISVTGFMKN